jgi:germination protein M
MIRQSSRTTILIAGLAMAALLVACSPSGGGLGPLPTGASPDPSVPLGSPDLTPQPSLPTATPSQPAGTPAPGTPTPGPTSQPSGTTVIRAYFILAGEPGVEGLVPVLRVVPATVAVARAAMLQLLEGPTADEQGASPGIGTAIPSGSGLLGLAIDGGVATVDLSGQFASGGGSTSTIYRLAQVVYTLTQFPTVESVVFRVDGQVVEVFGSEGLVLDGPQARADYDELLPDIWVDRPAWGAALGNPGRVTGSANVFEAAYVITLLDASGDVIYEEPTMATCGTGCRGTFDVMVDYEVGQAQWGTLRVWYGSAQDGSAQGVREYPVWLTPEG